jgi:uncharacterized protein YkwD
MKDLAKIFLILIVLSVNAFSQDSNDVRLVKRINDLRFKFGIKQLQWDSKLDSIAQSWAKQMLSALNEYTLSEISYNFSKQGTDFLHIDFDERTSKAKKFHKNMEFFEENVVLYVNSAPKNIVNSVFNDWKNSESHYEALIDKDAEIFGFGYTEDKETGRYLYILVLSKNKIEQKKGA